MRHTTFALGLITAAVLAGCGSGGGGDQTLKNKYTAQVTFGDSLTDVGTYNVGTIKALGGGKYTINGNNTSTNASLTGKNWTELMAAQLGLPAPCAAMTGLDGDASKGFSVPVQTFTNCYGYGQGGARVTNPVGPGNKLTGSPVGQLTVPVVTQVANHLAKMGGKFSGTEIVFVVAGGNDALELLGELAARATAVGNAEGTKVGGQVYIGTLAQLLAAGATDPNAAQAAIQGAMVATATGGGDSTAITTAGVGTAAAQPGNSAVASQAVWGPMVVKAQTAAAAAGKTAGAKAGADYAAAQGPSLVAEMGKAGAELAALVKGQIVGKGANYVVVGNLPDLAGTPSTKAQDAGTQALVAAMITAFNGQLTAGVSGESKILLVDLYGVSHDQVTNPAPYGLTNTSAAACGPNALGDTSLVCTGANVKAGDVSHYMFADGVHPTPFEGSLIAKFIAEKMIIQGWL